MPKVLIVGSDRLIESMFLQRGWTVVQSHNEEPDLVQFTGGEDVSPNLYGEVKHPATYNNPRRDDFEGQMFLQYKGQVPLAGICRGGQFLNVMNGGKMWQDVDGHTGSHYATDLVSGKEVMVTSTHHQMMIPADTARLLTVVDPARSTYRQTGVKSFLSEGPDIESVFYEDTQSLCFQPHPEYVKDDHECRELYFSYLEQFLNLK